MIQRTLDKTPLHQTYFIELWLLKMNSETSSEFAEGRRLLFTLLELLRSTPPLLRTAPPLTLALAPE